MLTLTHSGPAARNGGLASWFHRLADALRRARADRRAAKLLLGLDDYLLDDIGLTRDEVIAYFHR